MNFSPCQMFAVSFIWVGSIAVPAQGTTTSAPLQSAQEFSAPTGAVQAPVRPKNFTAAASHDRDLTHEERVRRHQEGIERIVSDRKKQLAASNPMVTVPQSGGRWYLRMAEGISSEEVKHLTSQLWSDGYQHVSSFIIQGLDWPRQNALWLGGFEDRNAAYLALRHLQEAGYQFTSIQSGRIVNEYYNERENVFANHLTEDLPLRSHETTPPAGRAKEPTGPAIPPMQSVSGRDARLLPHQNLSTTTTAMAKDPVMGSFEFSMIPVVDASGAEAPQYLFTFVQVRNQERQESKLLIDSGDEAAGRVEGRDVRFQAPDSTRDIPLRVEVHNHLELNGELGDTHD